MTESGCNCKHIFALQRKIPRDPSNIMKFIYFFFNTHSHLLDVRPMAGRPHSAQVTGNAGMGRVPQRVDAGGSVVSIRMGAAATGPPTCRLLLERMRD